MNNKKNEAEDRSNVTSQPLQEISLALATINTSSQEPPELLESLLLLLRSYLPNTISVIFEAAGKKEITPLSRNFECSEEMYQSAYRTISDKVIKALKKDYEIKIDKISFLLDTSPVFLYIMILRLPLNLFLVIARDKTNFSHNEMNLLQSVSPLIGNSISFALKCEEIKQMQVRQEHLQAIFDNSSDSILTIDHGFKVLEINDSATSLTGWNTKEAIGRTCMEVLMCRDDKNQLLCGTDGCPLAIIFQNNAPLPYYEVAFTPKEGKPKEVTASFTPIKSSDGQRGVIIARDVTPLNYANRMRSNFISMVSHELRTPLNSINGFLEIVADGHVGKLAERQKEFLGYARASTHQLITLVEDVLFISKADTGQFEVKLTEVDINGLISQTLRNLYQAVQAANITIHKHISKNLPRVHADAVRIQQVISNLINNAIKFTPSGGQVSIRVYAEMEYLFISVTDTGIGVPKEDQTHIFERFYQSDNAMLIKHGGYGLGLAIAKLIVDQHGGKIWLDSKPGHGSVFTFTLPLKSKEA